MPHQPLHSSARQTRGQWSLIGSLVAIAIIVLLAALYLPKLLAPQKVNGVDQTAIQQANGTACTIYLAQLNDASQEYKQDHGSNAPDLESLKQYGATDSMINAQGCYFSINPQTGVVSNTPISVPNAPNSHAPGAAPSSVGGVAIPPIPTGGG